MIRSNDMARQSTLGPIRILALGLVLLFAVACGESGAPAAPGGGQQAPENNWDAMNWDEGEWAVITPRGQSTPLMLA
jgi:hypothetical protein